MTEQLDPSASRAMWEAVERFHALTYIAPEVREEGAAVGLKGFYMNYFATRIAPVGAVGRDVVASTFFYFGPHRIHRAIPDAWTFSSPEQIIAARYRGMDGALRRIYPDVQSEAFVEAAALARRATAECEPIGRLLFTGWARLPWPDEPHLALWHACTLLREFRSGNHLIALCAEGLDGIESVVTHVAVGGAPRVWIREEAGWTEDDERAAVARLQRRGWLDDNGEATDECFTGRARVEALTDELDAPVWSGLGIDASQQLFDVLSQLVQVLPPDDQLDWQHHYGEGA